MTVDLTAQTPVASTVPHPFGSPSGPGLWKMQGLELDPYIQNVAHALLRSGSAKTESEAIHMAYGLVYNWSQGRTGNGKGRVHPDVQAAAAKSIANMNAKRAMVHAHSNTQEDGVTVDLAFSEALHPRVGAGNTGGGRFTAGQGGQQSQGKPPPKKRRRGKRKMHGPPPMRPPQGPNAPPRPPLTGRAAQAHNLRTRATALRTQADGLDAKADALAKAHPSSAPKSAASRAKATKAARKRNLPVHHATKHAGSKKRSGPSVASRVTNLRTMAKALRTRAAILDHRAGTLSMTSEAGTVIDLAGPHGFIHGWIRVGHPEGDQHVAKAKKAVDEGRHADAINHLTAAIGKAPDRKTAAHLTELRSEIAARAMGRPYKPKAKKAPARTRSMAGGSPSVDLAASVPCVTSGDGPRMTAMAGSKNAGSSSAVKVYRKLRAKGMTHGQALAMAKRAAAMKAKAA